MLMFTKKKAPLPNVYDFHRREIHDNLYNAWNELERRVKQTIIKQGVISLYPDGADKNKAEENFKKSQYSFLCAIGTYDCLRNDYLNYVKEHSGDFKVTADYITKWPTSHEIIEETYKEFFGKNS